MLPQLTLEFSILLGEQNSASENLTIRQYSFGFLPCLLLPKLHIILQELVGGAIKFLRSLLSGEIKNLSHAQQAWKRRNSIFRGTTLLGVKIHPLILRPLTHISVTGEPVRS